MGAGVAEQARGMLSGAVIAFGLVFLAELGDRTQLVVLTAGAKGRPLRLFIALLAVIALTHGVGVIAGDAVAELLPARVIAALTTALFAGFALWVWFDRDDEDGAASPRPPASTWKIALTFGLAELGDKSQLAAATLATREHAVGVWLGATAGEATVTALGLVAGRALAGRISRERLRKAGAAAFGLAALVSLVAAVVGVDLG